MSCMVVSFEHINAIMATVHGINYNGVNIWECQSNPNAYHFKHGLLAQAQAEANELHAANVAAYNERYNNPAETADPVKLNLSTKPVDPVQALKLVQCLEYQISDLTGYETRPAYKLLQSYKNQLIDRLCGYNAAKWTI